MKYVIVSIVKGNAGNFNNNLRKEVFEKFGAKSSKLPAHFTIKSPFESNDISEVDNIIKNFCKNNIITNYKIVNYDHFDNRVIYMKVFMSKEGKIIHDNLIDKLSTISYINFSHHDGKNKTFHITISSKKIQKIYDELWNYINHIPCNFDCEFDNISIFKWENNTWILHKKYELSRA